MSQENNNPVSKTIIGGGKTQEEVSIQKEIEDTSTTSHIIKDSDENPFEKTKIPNSYIVEAYEEPKKTEETIQKNENNNPAKDGDSLIKDEETLKMLRGLNFWSKFHVILGFISAGMLFLVGFAYIFLIVTIPITIIYWIMGGISVWLLTYLYRSFSKFNELTSVKTQEEFNNNVLQGLDLMKMYYKITGIFNIASLVLLVVAIIGGIFFLILFGSSPQFQDFLSNPKYSSASLILFLIPLNQWFF
jgi:hypothetical protein